MAFYIKWNSGAQEIGESLVVKGSVKQSANLRHRPVK